MSWAFPVGFSIHAPSPCDRTTGGYGVERAHPILPRLPLFHGGRVFEGSLTGLDTGSTRAQYRDLGSPVASIFMRYVSLMIQKFDHAYPHRFIERFLIAAVTPTLKRMERFWVRAFERIAYTQRIVGRIGFESCDAFGERRLLTFTSWRSNSKRQQKERYRQDTRNSRCDDALSESHRRGVRRG